MCHYQPGHPFRTFLVCLLGDVSSVCLDKGYRPVVREGNTFIKVRAQSEAQAKAVCRSFATVLSANDITEAAGVN